MNYIKIYLKTESLYACINIKLLAEAAIKISPNNYHISNYQKQKIKFNNHIKIITSLYYKV